MLKILFVCTHNRCRSILAQAITNHFNDPRVKAESAGAEPAGEVYPLTLEHLQQRNIETTGLHSKSWAELSDFAADVVVTVCDHAAKEPCPLWLGDAEKVHWGLPDPSKLDSKHEASLLFASVIETLKKRMKYILSHNVENMNARQLSVLFNKAMES